MMEVYWLVPGRPDYMFWISTMIHLFIRLLISAFIKFWLKMKIQYGWELEKGLLN
jgi:hypothetical protein